MLLVIYQHSGSKYVSKENATQQDLANWISRKTKDDDDWDIDWNGPNECEITHPNLASGFKAKLRPDDWPITNGEPA